MLETLTTQTGQIIFEYPENGSKKKSNKMEVDIMESIEIFRTQEHKQRPPDFIHTTELLLENDNYHLIVVNGHIAEIVRSNDIHKGYDKIIKLHAESISGQSTIELFKILMYMDVDLFNTVKLLKNNNRAIKLLRNESLAAIRKTVTIDFGDESVDWVIPKRQIQMIHMNDGTQKIAKFKYDYFDFTYYKDKFFQTQENIYL